MDKVYRPIDGLSDAINENIAESELAGGCWMKDVPVGTTVEVQTQNTLYQIRKKSPEETEIRGNARYCPDWTKAWIHGSTWGGSMLKVGFIGRGMYMEFSTDRHQVVVTSKIEDVREILENTDAV